MFIGVTPLEVCCRVDKYGRMTVEAEVSRERQKRLNRASFTREVSEACGRAFAPPCVSSAEDRCRIQMCQRPQLQIGRSRRIPATRPADSSSKRWYMENSPAISSKIPAVVRKYETLDNFAQLYKPLKEEERLETCDFTKEFAGRCCRAGEMRDEINKNYGRYLMKEAAELRAAQVREVVEDSWAKLSRVSSLYLRQHTPLMPQPAQMVSVDLLYTP